MNLLPFEELEFPASIRLLSRWQAGDEQASTRLRQILDNTIDGEYDDVFRVPAPQDSVHVSGSIDLLTLGVMNDLYGLTASQFYKDDPNRYVRSVLMTMKMLGMQKLYLSWPVYGFTAEALGQEMIYSDRFSPGTDPEKTLVDADTWHELTTPDLESGIPRIVAENVAVYSRLTGSEPVLQLSAPYSLAADIYGQELLINELTHNPDMVNSLLDHLADTILRPWMEHFFARHPDGRVELSDASGSPFFIGPENCRDVAIRPIKRLKQEQPWGGRVYVANYRGDYVTQVNKGRSTSSRRRSSRRPEPNKVSLEELFAAKNSVCRDYVIRLADDRLSTSFYVDRATEMGIPLFLGIGATEIDRNSIADLEVAKSKIRATSAEHVEAIKTVARTIAANGHGSKVPPWPGAVYFEDVSAESSFDLVEIIIGTVLDQGTLQ